MNCEHRPDGWCLDCARNLHDSVDELVVLLFGEQAAHQETLMMVATLKARVAELEEFVRRTYCVACDSQAMIVIRYGGTPTHSPMPELKGLEDAAHRLVHGKASPTKAN